ncbi:MAG: hypothetical protein IPM41_00240 [Sphingomonadales bacterium]|nr:hypothetical protein [Sphingomonadales bacterium]
MGQFSTEIYILPGSTLSGNQHSRMGKSGGKGDRIVAGVRRKVKSSVELPQLVRQTSRIAFVVATVGCFGLPSQALALQQEGGAEVEKVEQGERDIVVTATKRDQTLEEVPIAVTVVGQEELISKGIEDITNLERG